jgi:hypothetical protein
MMCAYYSILTSGSYVLVSVHIKGTTQHGAAPPHKVGERHAHRTVEMDDFRHYIFSRHFSAPEI